MRIAAAVFMVMVLGACVDDFEGTPEEDGQQRLDYEMNQDDPDR